MGITAIQIDQREARWVTQLAFGGVPKLVTLLDAGDLLIATDDGSLLGIERKEASDFLNSLRDDRLFPQLVRLKGLTPWAYLAIVGDLRPGANGITYADGRETGWQWASVDGALLSVQEIGIHVVHVASDYDFEAAMIRLANRDRSTLRVRPLREGVAMSEGEAIIASLPGIGSDRAAAIMAECGDAYTALAWLTLPDRFCESVTVAGVRDGTKRRVRKALGLPDDQYLRTDYLTHELRKESERQVCGVS